MRKLPLLLILLCLGDRDASANVMDPNVPIALRAADRAAVDKAACASTGKPALSIEAWRNRDTRALTASVLCEDSVENDDYRAYFHRSCAKDRRGWTCDPPVIALNIEAVNGPYEIRVDDFSLGEALPGIKCLDTIYDQDPQILNGARRGKIVALYAAERDEASKDQLMTAYIEARNECFWLTYPPQCRVDDAGRVPVTATSGCIDE